MHINSTQAQRCQSSDQRRRADEKIHYVFDYQIEHLWWVKRFHHWAEIKRKDSDRYASKRPYPLNLQEVPPYESAYENKLSSLC